MWLVFGNAPERLICPATDALEGGPHRMSGFTNKGAFSITKEPFGGWAADLAKVVSGLQPRIASSIDQVMAGMEKGLRDEITAHPDWPSDIADKASIRARDGEYEVLVDDQRAHGLEYGLDPEKSPSPVIEPFGAKTEAAAGQEISAAIRKAVRL